MVNLEQARAAFLFCINSHPNLQARERSVFIEIIRSLDTDFRSTIDREQMCKNLGYSRITVDRAVRSLRNKRFIDTTMTNAHVRSTPILKVKILSDIRRTLREEIARMEAQVESLNAVITALKGE